MRALSWRPITSRIYAWCVNNNGSWVVSSPAVNDGKVYFATSDSRLYQIVDALTGKPVLQQEEKAYIFSSPVIAGDVVLLGVTNGSLLARDRVSGKVLWEFQTEASQRNLGWVLTADRHFNNSLLLRSQWQEPTIVATTRMQSVGTIFSTPLVGDGVVYVGSTDGNLYAIE